MPEPRALSLSDDQINAIFAAAQPLLPADRDPFLRAIAASFAGRSEIGDGELHRRIAELQTMYFRAPSGIEVVRGAPKQLEKFTRKLGRPVGATGNR